MAKSASVEQQDMDVNEFTVVADAGIRSGMTVAFKDVEYVVKNSQNRKEEISLLTRVSGYLLPGQMTALMGPSGSGKTTLLDLLAGRKTVGQIHGSILFAGRQPTQNFLRRFTGYVEQFDTLIPNLTVAEMLLYTAEMKNPISMSRPEKAALVDQVISQLALSQCRDVIIGDPLHRGISGGQAKRVNIGLALVTSPRVLFLDEPTSGLDSYTANEVMTLVKSLVSSVTICATIHSPTPYAFSLFDRLTILLRGVVVYSGDNGHSAIQYFEDQFPQTQRFNRGANNEAEWLCDITVQADRDNRAAEFAAVYAKSELKQQTETELQTVMQQHSSVSQRTIEELSTKSANTTPSVWAWRTMLKYRAARNLRDPNWLGPRIGDKLIVTLLLMTLYWRLGHKDTVNSANVNNIAAMLFMWVILPGFTAVSYVPAIVLERSLFVRERNDGLYRVITYLCYKMTEELFIALMNSIVFSLIVFYTVNLRGDWVVFFLVYYITTCIGIVMAYTVAAVSPNMDVANAATPAYVVTLLFFVGQLIRLQDIPDYWYWYSFLDFLRFAWGAVMVNQFESADVPIYNGTPVLEFFSLGTVNKWAFIGYELIFFAVFFTLAWVALAFKKHVQR